MNNPNTLPKGIDLGSLIYILLTTKEAYSYSQYLRMTRIASKIYDKFYTHIEDYEEYIAIFKVQFKDVFTKEELEELE